MDGWTMEHNVKYDDGVERGAVLCTEGACLSKAGRTPSTKTAAGGKKDYQSKIYR